jgi:peptide chain release factor 1
MDEAFREKLEAIKAEYETTLLELVDPEILADRSRHQAIMMKHGGLKSTMEAYRRYVLAQDEADEASELAAAESDGEMRAYFETVLTERQSELAELDSHLATLLVPKDPNDDKDVIVELRSAAGGDEAGLWAADLYRMYGRFAEINGWTVETINESWAEGKGLAFGQFAVKGRGAYSRFKWEAGAHRVQRVPKTESQGRVHTSIATVAVLPEATAIDVAINERDLQVETFRSQGPGGQSVNTTDSAVRITHVPSGIVVSCQDEKSQLQNKLKAMRVLRARLYQRQLDEQLGERADARKSQVGSGERAEKIRTYNFKENRVTDHRVSLTLHSLGDVLDGGLSQFHEALAEHEAGEALGDR